MGSEFQVIVVSDIHYASEAEKARRGYETRVIPSPTQRLLVHLFRRFVWLAEPMAHNHMLDRFLAAAGEGDCVVANGDYSCDSDFVGVSDDAAFTSALEVMTRLRARFGPRLVAGFGDHELGKMSLLGGVGGPRIASFERGRLELGLEPCWRREAGPWVLLGVVSTLVAMPVFEPETLEPERPRWRELREQHLLEIEDAFRSLAECQRVVLFCHDPTAIPFLWQQPAVRDRIGQVAMTVIGHLHTPLILWQSRLLAGMPTLRFLGNSVRRMSAALRQARHWKAFSVALCPSLTGCQLLKDGGFGSLRLATDGSSCGWQVRRLPW